jgi:hypothetical protein
MHEDSTYYQQCLYRERNKGLFIADQVIWIFVIIARIAKAKVSYLYTNISEM